MVVLRGGQCLYKPGTQDFSQFQTLHAQCLEVKAQDTTGAHVFKA